MGSFTFKYFSNPNSFCFFAFLDITFSTEERYFLFKYFSELIIFGCTHIPSTYVLGTLVDKYVSVTEWVCFSVLHSILSIRFSTSTTYYISFAFVTLKNTLRPCVVVSPVLFFLFLSCYYIMLL